MTAGDVINAIKEQNRQVAAGRLGQPPVPGTSPIQFQLPLKASERLSSEEQFRDIIVRTGAKGGVVHLQDLVIDDVTDKNGQVTQKGVELGAKNYDVNSYLDGDPSATLAIFQLPGSNAVKTAEAIKAKMEELRGRFPEGVDYRIHYDTTVFIDESIASVLHTLIEAFVLVFIVVLVFLQNWRATIVPMVAVPVSLIGTLAVMIVLGFSLNNLSLFGLVLTIGIVVDDAIVVVENVERWMAQGLSPRDASRKAMDEVTGPVIAIALVLCAVFVPTAFMAGISGQFYRQFALTIAASTIISAFNSLTLSPALCAILLKPHAHGHGGQSHQEALPRLGIAVIGGLVAFVFLLDPVAHLFHLEVGGHGAHGGHDASMEHAGVIGALQAGLSAAGCLVGWLAAGPVNWLLGLFFRLFNKAFDVTISGYGKVVGLLLRLSVPALAVYGGLMVLTYVGFKAVPVGLIPEQDKGYLVVNVQLPDGATLDRTDRFVRDLAEEVRKDPGVYHTIEVPGYSILLSSNISNVGGMFVLLKPFEERAGDPELGAPAVIKRLCQKFAAYRDAKLAVFGAPPVDGLGSTGGFKLQVQDRRGAGLTALQGAAALVAEQGNADPKLQGLFTSFSVSQPQLRIEVDEEKAKTQQVALSDIDQTMQANLGSFYVNDFFFQNRNWQVNVQAGPAYRDVVGDIGNLEVRNAKGDRVPLRTLVKVINDSGPPIVNHYNLYPSAEVNGSTAPGVSSGQAIQIMDGVTANYLPSTMGAEWTELTYQQILAGQDLLTKLAFPLAVVFVFLVLAAQYESWSLPLSIILIVPMCLFAAIAGVWLAGMENNIFTQVGLVVLIGLATKNAILIVEFAKQLQDQGKPRFEATVEASKQRLRPILMTSFAFILGVVPLVLAQGAGAEMRVALGWRSSAACWA
jgi:multidrug efflux pump subunit AcrB